MIDVYIIYGKYHRHIYSVTYPLHPYSVAQHIHHMHVCPFHGYKLPWFTTMSHMECFNPKKKNSLLFNKIVLLCPIAHAMSPPELQAHQLVFPLYPSFALVVLPPFHIVSSLLSQFCFGEESCACSPFSLKFYFIFLAKNGGEWWHNNPNTTTSSIMHR